MWGGGGKTTNHKKGKEKNKKDLGFSGIKEIL